MSDTQALETQKKRVYESIFKALGAIPVEEVIERGTVRNALKVHAAYALGKRIANDATPDEAIAQEIAEGKSVLADKKLGEDAKRVLAEEIIKSIELQGRVEQLRGMKSSNPKTSALIAIKGIIANNSMEKSFRQRLELMDNIQWANFVRETPDTSWREHMSVMAFDPIERAMNASDAARIRELYMGFENMNSEHIQGLTVWGRLEKVGCEAAMKELKIPVKSGKKLEI